MRCAGDELLPCDGKRLRGSTERRLKHLAFHERLQGLYEAGLAEQEAEFEAGAEAALMLHLEVD